jgi:nucleoid DNA-binding protein
MDNKKLVETVAANLGRSTEDVGKLLDSLAGVLSARCGDMDTVVIPSFGAFEPKKRNERVMLHPSTGRRMLVPPRVVLSFKISQVLKAKLK